MQHVLSRCATYQKSKSKFHKGLYTPLPVPELLWDSVSMDFVVGLPITQREKDAIKVLVDRFINVAHFFPMHKTDEHVADLYL